MFKKDLVKKLKKDVDMFFDDNGFAPERIVLSSSTLDLVLQELGSSYLCYDCLEINNVFIEVVRDNKMPVGVWQLEEN